MESIAIAVPRKKAEQVKKRLVEKRALRTDLQIESDQRNVYFPVSQNLEIGFDVVTREFKEQKRLVTDYRELLSLPEDLQPLLPSSFDVIGHVAILKLPDELMSHSKEIGRAIAKVNKPIKTVCLDEGVKGETRTRELKILTGDKNTLTVYKEHGLTFKVDPRTMFFSPRLATERKLIADQVAPGEKVFDMFAGVGPFSVLIAKTRSPESVYACDINPDAVELLKENARINKVEDKVHPILGNAREIAGELPMMNRIIMNLPHSAFEFLDAACAKILPGGCIHFYDILDEAQLEQRAEQIKERFDSLGRGIASSNTRVVKSYSPTMRYYAMDIIVS